MPSTPTGELVLAGLDSPVRFGKYTLLTRLATGGMGEVYVAQMGGAAGFEKQVVIKRILPQLAGDAQFVRMFLDEARITAQLNHPNICQVFELGESDGEYYIAMEYLQGLPLSRLIHKHAAGGIDLRVVAGIMVQACEGLTYAHDFHDPARRIDGVVHRDVSPQNLFVTAPGLVKVLDFGVAKLYREGSQTVTVSTKGKHLYMSPEQVNGDPIDQRSDLFALATVMYEALTGQALFGRPTQYLTLQAIVTGDRPRLRALRPDIPAAVEEVLDRALSLKAVDRFPSGRAMAEALTFAISSLGGPASIIELAQFVQREHVDELSSERMRIQRASARVPASRLSSELPVPALEDDLTRIEDDLEVIDEREAGEGYDDDDYDDYDDYDDEDYDDDGVIEADDTAHDAVYDQAYDDDAGEAPTMEAPPRLAPSRSSRPLEFVRLNAQDEVADYFDLRTQRWRRYLRWVLVASITLAAALWFGRDWLGLQASAPAPDLDAPGAIPSQADPGRVDEVAGAAQDSRPAMGRGDDPDRPRGDQAGAAPPADTRPGTGGDTRAGERDVEPPPDDDRGARPRRGTGRQGARASADEPRELADGYFTIDAQPYAEIYVDGTKVGLTPLVMFPLEPGRHRVRAVAVESGKSESFRIQILPKKVVTRQIRFTDSD